MSLVEVIRALASVVGLGCIVAGLFQTQAPGHPDCVCSGGASANLPGLGRGVAWTVVQMVAEEGQNHG